ncbi:MAG: NADH-quinone oxidoreductase subunit A [Symbiobacterium thermophilum]|uniref:NADH-quinone oxidoreductase subunit A n=1 Tax=Symbiobacterium thermophilum TaxID=2734 RepID=A0A1Y2T498_SYMTR|nr:MAG: NADH-quinone oxidoreductase subunit A [Symbiobacterium thermophilum]
MQSSYLPVLIYLLVALLFAAAMSVLGTSFGRKKPEPYKLQPYESGYPTAPFLGRFPVKFYLVAMLFVIFDVEAASFYPWAVNLRELGGFGLVEMITFMAVLAIGYAYVWKKGGFDWR